MYTQTTQFVQPEDLISFELDGAFSAGITHVPGAPDLVVNVSGTYYVNFEVSVQGDSQIALFQNGVPVPGSIRSSGPFTPTQIIGSMMLVMAAGDTLAIANHTTPFQIIVEPPSGGTLSNVSAALTLMRVA